MSDSEPKAAHTVDPQQPQPAEPNALTVEQIPRPAPQQATSATVIPATPSVPIANREELLARARTFLRSPQIQYQDMLAKRRFLAEKGLTDAEIDTLMREQPLPPMIPPRTYPQPPPSNLPTLLLGLVRLFSYIGMGSVAILFAYYRWMHPRIVATAEARRSLRTHHLSLLRQLTTSLSALKESQSESLADLPHHDSYRESEQFIQCRTLSQVLTKLGDAEPDYTTIAPVTLLRCAIADFTKGKSGEEAQPTTEDIFLLLEGKIPWLALDNAYDFKKTIFETLVSCPHFEELEIKSDPETEPTHPSQRKWRYIAPPQPEPSPVIASLSKLNTALPKSCKDEFRSSVFQHTLQTLTEFTGYISSNVYVPYRPPAGMGISSSYGLSPAEEALKKDIRALKGLVLNRKTFMPSIPRPPSFQTQTPSKPVP